MGNEERTLLFGVFSGAFFQSSDQERSPETIDASADQGLLV